MRTMTIERRMKPAADASLAGSAEYTKVFTMAVEYVRPAARKPTTCEAVSTYAVTEGTVDLQPHDRYASSRRPQRRTHPVACKIDTQLPTRQMWGNLLECRR